MKLIHFFVTQKIAILTKRAYLRCPEADIRLIDFDDKRNLDRVSITELATYSLPGACIR